MNGNSSFRCLCVVCGSENIKIFDYFVYCYDCKDVVEGEIDSDNIKRLIEENKELRGKLQKAEEREKIRLQQIHEYSLTERKLLEKLDNAGLLRRE